MRPLLAPFIEQTFPLSNRACNFSFTIRTERFNNSLSRIMFSRSSTKIYPHFSPVDRCDNAIEHEPTNNSTYLLSEIFPASTRSRLVDATRVGDQRKMFRFIHEDSKDEALRGRQRSGGGKSWLGRWNSRNAEGMVGEEASSLNSLPIPEIVAPECAIFLSPLFAGKEGGARKVRRWREEEGET